MRNKGFTVIELMIALLIVAILAAIAVPSFRDFIGNSKVTGATNDLVTALNIARSEALQRATAVSVCASADTGVVRPTLPTCSGSTTWTTGWIAFTDDDAGTAGIRDGNDVVIQAWRGPQGNMTAIGTVSFVRYEVTGTISPPIGAATGAIGATFDVKQTGCVGNKKGRTEVNVIGTIRSTKVACP